MALKPISVDITNFNLFFKSSHITPSAMMILKKPVGKGIFLHSFNIGVEPTKLKEKTFMIQLDRYNDQIYALYTADESVTADKVFKVHKNLTLDSQMIRWLNEYITDKQEEFKTSKISENCNLCGLMFYEGSYTENGITCILLGS